jgi:tetratricopeptide (TPR) repeat protein
MGLWYGTSVVSCMPALSRPWKRSPVTGWPNRSSVSPITRCGGEVWGKAVTYCRQAGARAHDRAAFHEAAAAFEQAVQALVHLPEHPETGGLALELRLAWGRALYLLGEYGRYLALLGEAEALARALDDRRRLGWVLAQMARVRRQTGDLDGAMAAGQQTLALAAALGDRALQAEAAFYLGQVCWSLGDFGRAAALLRQNVEGADGEPGTLSTSRFISSRAWLVRTLSALGAFAEAGATGRRRSASPCGKAEAISRWWPTATSASCTSPKGTWSVPSGCMTRA